MERLGSSNLSIKRYSSVPCLQTLSESKISLSRSLTNIPYSPTPPTDQDFLRQFNITPDNDTISSTNDQDLMDINFIDESNVFESFDPLRQIGDPFESEEVLVDMWSSASSPSLLHRIKLRLKLSTCPEMKSFYQLVQNIRNEYLSKETPTDEIFYCKRVQRLTTQHIEQNQSPVTLFIFTDHSKEAIHLPQISLQSPVEHILTKLLEIIPFDYDQSILKLRSYEEYLRNEDVLCDIEYVHKCINSLKPLQFVLVKKPKSIFEQKFDELSFEQFSFNRYGEYLQMIKSMKLSNKKEIPSDQTRWFVETNSRWLEDFCDKLNQIFQQIERRFNNLIEQNLTIDEQIQLIDDLFNYLKNIQNICSNIRSISMRKRQRELQHYKTQLKKEIEKNSNSDFIQLLWNVLRTIEKYIKTYCQAFLIPYKVEICDDDHKPVDISMPITKCSIPNSLETFSIHIENLFSLSSAIENVCIVARLCYGNKTKSKQMTRVIPCPRHRWTDISAQIRLNENISFNDVYICGLEREALILFEIYANFNEEIDSGLTCEIIHGNPMYLIGWCSQALFDHEYNLMTGECYLGIINASEINPAGFYSLRNVFDRECSVLTISFPDQVISWPNIQPRGDIQGYDFTEIDRDKQEYICRLLDRPSLLFADHSTMSEESSMTQSIPNKTDADYEMAYEECHILWSHRRFLTHKPHALPNLLKSRSVWDYPSLIDIYGLVELVAHNRNIDEIEAFELLLPAFPDMHIRSFAYQTLLSQLTSHDLLIYLPQLLQIIKFDYKFSSPIIEYLLKQSIHDHRLAHKLYWYLRQLLLTENIHFIRYYYLFTALLYVVGENFRVELQNEYNLCLNLKKIGTEIKIKSNRGPFFTERLKELNQSFFNSGQNSCRLPCQFSFPTNNIDVNSCSIFSSLTSPMKLVFNPIDSTGERYNSMYKIGDDLRQDQIVLQLLSCMDKIWQANDFDFRLSLFNVVQTEARCGFVEMVTESETLMDIEKPLGAIKGSFGESALYDWLRLHNTNERDFRIALDNLTYSCAGYCVGTYILGIGDRHNENIMVKKSGQLFHIDFGKYLGDTQKFGWFNRDRIPLIFTKQMLYAMSDGGTSTDAMHRFVDLCCNAFYTLRQNSSLLLVLLAHLCSSNVPNLNHNAVRYVYDRLALSLNYAQSITHFTNLIFDSLNSTWIQWNGLIHKLAQTTSLQPNGPTLSFVPNTYTIFTDGKIRSVQVVNHEKNQRSKYYLYKIQVERLTSTYHYRTYNEFYEFYERLNKQFPLIGLELKYSQQTEDKILAQRRVSDINDFLGNLFRLSSDIIESDLVCTFFHLIQRDQQINEMKEKLNQELSPRSSTDSSTRIRLQLKYDNGKLFVMVRHANNLPLKNGNEPKPYCKCYLFPDERKSTKRKGKMANSRNPIFNDTFLYEMDLSEIQKRVLRVSVWNNILTVGNRVLGEVDIVLSQIDWSKENARDYALATLDSSIFFQI